MKLKKMIREKWVRVIWKLLRDGTSILQSSFHLLFFLANLAYLKFSWKDSEPQKYVISIALLSRNIACFT